MKARRWAAALLAAASCRSARPAPNAAGADAPSPPAADAGRPVSGSAGPDAGVAEDPAAAALAAAAQDPARQIEILEDAAQVAADPAELLLRAARARRERLEVALAAADPSLADAARDAQACAADAHRAWAQRFPEAAAALAAGRPAADAYAQVTAAEPLYLEAVCAAAWARTQGFTPLVERRAELGAALRRAAVLAPALDFAGPSRELGRLLAALPTYAGGDLAESRRAFESALQLAPGAAVNRLAFAQAVAVKAQDRALFEEQLRPVAESSDPAAARAAALLAREDDLFGPAQAAQPIPGGSTK